MADQCISIEEQAFLSDVLTGEVGTFLREQLAITDATTSARAAEVDEGLSIADDFRYSLSYQVNETLAVADAAGVARDLDTTVVERLQVRDRALAQQLASVAELLQVADGMVMGRHFRLADQIQVADAALPDHLIVMGLADALVVTDAMIARRTTTVADLLQAADTITVRRVMAFGDELAIDGDVEVGGNLAGDLADVLRALDAVALTTRHIASLGDALMVLDEAIPPDSATAWTANTDTFAASRYTDFPFNSIAAIGETLFGAADDGLYALDDRDDDGTPVAASILTDQRSGGDQSVRRGGYVYAGMAADGSMRARVHSVVNGQRTAYAYTFESRINDDIAPMRVKYGKGVKSLMWQFEVFNQDGTDFRISGGLAWVIDPGTRRV